MSHIPALAILGPTASGKTALGLHLAEQGHPVEIISLDSALVFRDMNIGTAKPSAAELFQVPHHLIDIISPEEVFNASDFVGECNRLIFDIRQRGKVPLILGGTMMYYKALVSGLDDMPTADAAIRQQIEIEAATHGWPYMHERLMGFDPLTAARLKPNDSQRIERALEVYLLSGKPLSEFHTRAQAEPIQLTTLSLEPSDRKILHQRIHNRFINMLEHGFLDEVIDLKRKYTLTPDMPSMRCVGYRQAWEYLEGSIDHPTLIEKGVAATRQLAKRQLTWLRSTSNKVTVDPLQEGWIQSISPWLNQQIEHINALPV